MAYKAVGFVPVFPYIVINTVFFSLPPFTVLPPSRWSPSSFQNSPFILLTEFPFPLSSFPENLFPSQSLVTRCLTKTTYERKGLLDLIVWGSVHPRGEDMMVRQTPAMEAGAWGAGHPVSVFVLSPLDSVQNHQPLGWCDATIFRVCLYPHEYPL